MVDATVEKKGEISDDELILLCLKNAPEGTNRKQVISLIRSYEDKCKHYT